MGSLSLLQGIFPTQGLNPGLLHCRRILYQLSHQGSPRILEWITYPFSRGSSQSGKWTGVSCIAGKLYTNWAIREALKNRCFQIVVLEKTLETPLDSKEIQPVNPKGNQHWLLIGRIAAEAETPIFWPPDAKSWLIGKDPDAGKDLGKKRKVQQRMRWLDSITNTIWCKWIWAKSGREWRTGKPGVLQSAGLQSQTWLSNWATITNILI